MVIFNSLYQINLTVKDTLTESASDLNDKQSICSPTVTAVIYKYLLLTHVYKSIVESTFKLAKHVHLKQCGFKCCDVTSRMCINSG